MEVSSKNSRFLNFLIKLSSVSEKRELTGIHKATFSVICIIFSLFYLYTAAPPIFGTPGVGLKRGLFMMLMSIMVFMLYPASKRSPRHKFGAVDYLLIFLSIVTFGYWIIYFTDMIMRTGNPSSLDIFFGGLAVLVSLEATRRVLGWILPILAVLFMLYANLGAYLPRAISHNGFSWSNIFAEMFTQNAIFGIVLETTAAYVVLFVVFGALLNAFGAGEFFVRFPYALTAGSRGGPAKAAVVASGMMGMISGSATANTVATGTFTIPLMKKAGYKPHVAGAIEPAASTGGMFMPPIMGAGVFIMAEMIQVPYAEIMVAAFVPAVLYFFSVAVMAHFEALKDNIKVVPKSERDSPWLLLKEGWFYLTPILLIVFLMLIGVTPSRSVFWTIVTLIIVSIFVRIIRREPGVSKSQIIKDSIKDIGKGLEDGAKDSLVVGSVVGTVGIILGIIFLSGLGFIFTTSVMKFTYGYLPLGILLAFITSYILGMGMTVTSAYILMAVLVAPALQTMGVSALAAHMLVFWYCQSSNISPPVCLAAFAGAAIAKSDPIKTGFTAMKYGVFMFIIPLLFVYSPILMPEGFTTDVLVIMVTTFLGVIPMGAAITGYFIKKTNWLERVVLVTGAICLILPLWQTIAIGLLCVIAVYIKQKKSINQKVLSA